MFSEDTEHKRARTFIVSIVNGIAIGAFGDFRGEAYRGRDIREKSRIKRWEFMLSRRSHSASHWCTAGAGVPRLGTQPPTSQTWVKWVQEWRSDAPLDLLLRWLEELLIVRKMANARPNIIVTHHGYCYGVASRDLQGRQQDRLRRELGPAKAVYYT